LSAISSAQKNLGIKTAFARYGDEFKTQESGADFDLTDIKQIIEIIEQEKNKTAVNS